ncbi:hypothetical protein JCM17380_27750 [Desulfosporosinus burensis]
MEQLRDFSKGSEDMISNQDLYVTMMRKVWLDNALNIACQEVCQLLKEITNGSERDLGKQKIFYREPSFKKALKQEWKNKELALEHLANVLEVARQQIRLESQIICEEELSISNEEIE